MHINTCAPLIEDLHTHCSFLLKSRRCGILPGGVCLCSVSSSCSHTQSCTGEATGSGSSRHLSTVSKARSEAVYCWSSSLREEPPSRILFFIGSGAPTAHDVSTLGMVSFQSFAVIEFYTYPGPSSGTEISPSARLPDHHHGSPGRGTGSSWSLDHGDRAWV